MVQFIESELLLLKKEVSEMWMLVYSQMERARDAVLEMNVEMTQQVAVREKRVNAFELKIDSDVEDVISLYNPVAVDLRFALAMLKINSNLERIGDFAEGIANFASLEKIPLQLKLQMNYIQRQNRSFRQALIVQSVKVSGPDIFSTVRMQYFLFLA